MNKCNFCIKSIPTGSIGAWKCEEEHSCHREKYCKEALATMIHYNETRASKQEEKHEN